MVVEFWEEEAGGVCEMVTEHEERRKDEEVMVIEGKRGAVLVGS